jgi:excinuclease ABC subunit A
VKSKGWFFHAITGDQWLLKLKFRVPLRAFSKQQLLAVLTLPTLNEIEEIERYGNQSRVRAHQEGTWMELDIDAFTYAELDQPSLWDWLTAAMRAFLEHTGNEVKDSAPGDIEASMPWKVLGQRWHSLRKGFPPGKDVVWPADTLSVLVQAVHQTAPDGRWRWDDRTQARCYLTGSDQPWITVHTKRPEGLIVMLDGPPLADLSELVATMPVTVNWTNRGEQDQQLQMAFVATQQPRDPSFRKLLAKHLQTRVASSAD